MRAIADRIQALDDKPPRVLLAKPGIPEGDRTVLLAGGVARVFTPEGYDLSASVSEMADLALAARR